MAGQSKLKIDSRVHQESKRSKNTQSLDPDISAVEQLPRALLWMIFDSIVRDPDGWDTIDYMRRASSRLVEHIDSWILTKRPMFPNMIVRFDDMEYFNELGHRTIPIRDNTFLCTIEFRGGEDSENAKSRKHLARRIEATQNEKFHLRMGTRRFHDGRKVLSFNYCGLEEGDFYLNLLNNCIGGKALEVVIDKRSESIPWNSILLILSKIEIERLVFQTTVDDSVVNDFFVPILSHVDMLEIQIAPAVDRLEILNPAATLLHISNLVTKLLLVHENVEGEQLMMLPESTDLVDLFLGMLRNKVRQLWIYYYEPLPDPYMTPEDKARLESGMKNIGKEDLCCQVIRQNKRESDEFIPPIDSWDTDAHFQSLIENEKAIIPKENVSNGKASVKRRIVTKRKASSKNIPRKSVKKAKGTCTGKKEYRTKVSSERPKSTSVKRQVKKNTTTKISGKMSKANGTPVKIKCKKNTTSPTQKTTWRQGSSMKNTPGKTAHSPAACRAVRSLPSKK